MLLLLATHKEATEIPTMANIVSPSTEAKERNLTAPMITHRGEVYS
jgi:hypothetical protein